MFTAPLEHQVGVDAVSHRDAGDRSTGQQALPDQLALEFGAVVAPAAPGGSVLIGHGVRLRCLMHTISGAQDQPILVKTAAVRQRAVRPRLRTVRNVTIVPGL